MEGDDRSSELMIARSVGSRSRSRACSARLERAEPTQPNTVSYSRRSKIPSSLNRSSSPTRVVKPSESADDPSFPTSGAEFGRASQRGLKKNGMLCSNT